MAIIKNEDLDIMIDVEMLLHKKLVATNGIKDDFNGKEYYYFDENDEEYEIWCKYWNLVEKFIADKKDYTKRVNGTTKEEKRLHNIYNNIGYARRNHNQEKLEYWQQKLKEFRER